jgi:hypothetical protein
MQSFVIWKGAHDAALLLVRRAVEEWERVDPSRRPDNLKILERDEWRCQAPGCTSRSATGTTGTASTRVICASMAMRLAGYVGSSEEDNFPAGSPAPPASSKDHDWSRRNDRLVAHALGRPPSLVLPWTRYTSQFSNLVHN